MMKKPDPRSSAVPEVVEKEELDVLVETREQREEVGAMRISQLPLNAPSSGLKQMLIHPLCIPHLGFKLGTEVK